MAAVARTICLTAWKCSNCVINNCLFLISEDKSSGCFSSIVGRPKVKRQLDTLSDCQSVMADDTIGADSFEDYSDDVAEILGSGTVGIVIGVLVALVVCFFYLRRQGQRLNQDPEMAQPGENGGVRANGNYSPRNLLRALGNGIRTAAMMSRVVRQISRFRQRRNDEVPLVPNEEIPVGLGSPRPNNQDEELGERAEGRPDHRNYNPRNILRAAEAVRGVGSMVSAFSRRIFLMRQRQNDQVPLVRNEEAQGFENLAMDNRGPANPRPPSPAQVQANQFEPPHNRVEEPRLPLMDPDRRSPIRDLFEDGIEDAEMARILNSSQLVMNTSTSSSTSSNQSSLDEDNHTDEDSDNLSDSTDSTVVPADDAVQNDLSFEEEVTESTVVSAEESEFSDANDTMEFSTDNQVQDTTEEGIGAMSNEEEFVEVNLDDNADAASSFSIGSSESTPSRRIQPSRAAKNESNEMIKAMRKHKLI